MRARLLSCPRLIAWYCLRCLRESIRCAWSPASSSSSLPPPLSLLPGRPAGPPLPAALLLSDGSSLPGLQRFCARPARNLRLEFRLVARPLRGVVVAVDALGGRPRRRGAGAPQSLPAGTGAGDAVTLRLLQLAHGRGKVRHVGVTSGGLILEGEGGQVGRRRRLRAVHAARYQDREIHRVVHPLRQHELPLLPRLPRGVAVRHVVCDAFVPCLKGHRAPKAPDDELQRLARDFAAQEELQAAEQEPRLPRRRRRRLLLLLLLLLLPGERPGRLELLDLALQARVRGLVRPRLGDRTSRLRAIAPRLGNLYHGREESGLGAVLPERGGVAQARPGVQPEDDEAQQRLVELEEGAQHAEIDVRGEHLRALVRDEPRHGLPGNLGLVVEALH